MASLATIVFWGCKKDKDLNDDITPTPQHIFANAGPDTTVNSILRGSGYYFSSFLNGKASYSLAGNIVSYSWTAINQGPFDFSISSENSDSTDLFLMEWPDLLKPKNVAHLFRLEVKDDHQNVDDDTVAITTYRNFLAEYRELSWDSIVGNLAYLNIKPKTDEIVNYQPFYGNYAHDTAILNLCDFISNCDDIANWMIIPYVPYNSIHLADNALFFLPLRTTPMKLMQATPGLLFMQHCNLELILARKYPLVYTDYPKI